jgi:hypothetical protein
MLAGLFFSVSAVVMALNDLSAMKAGAMRRDGRGLTLAGLWLGLIASVLTLCVGAVVTWVVLTTLFDAI